MRPISLMMSAFKSYAGVVTVDFDRLRDSGVFLVSGPTGAGKTTIYDGITYALFDKASMERQDRAGLRSDYADEHTRTEVDFTFVLHGKTYRIVRSPAQPRPKRRGAGITEEEPKVMLYAGERVYTKAGEANEKIVQLLGLKYEQFKQIVMIAQGEFLKLIHASSADRESIFREIFGTELFLDIPFMSTDSR